MLYHLLQYFNFATFVFISTWIMKESESKALKDTHWIHNFSSIVNALEKASHTQGLDNFNRHQRACPHNQWGPITKRRHIPITYINVKQINYQIGANFTVPFRLPFVHEKHVSAHVPSRTNDEQVSSTQTLSLC